MDTKLRTGLTYMPQLDAVRTFAVSFVLLQHFVGLNNLPPLIRTLPWGHLGVLLFFVLSGFLITGILIRSSDLVVGKKQSAGFAARQFYIRRFLRIFPLYYFVIALGLVLAIPPAREIWHWLISYTTNFYISLRGDENYLFSNFWSLAVEEQFYVVWPWVVLFAPRKWLFPATLLMIASGPAWRLYAFTHGLNFVALYKMTPACLDSLGMGALLAQAHHSSLTKKTIQKYVNRLILPAGLILSVGLWALVYFEINWSANIVLFDLSMAMIFCWFISSASVGFGGIAGSLMASKPLVYCGKISYGIYVYHQFTPAILIFLAGRLGFSYQPLGWRSLFLGVSLTLVIASLSWRLLEQPVSNLKRYFSYRAVPQREPEEIKAFSAG
jgi:peptidoglycan/LPS O-acetylase OafA/YrhL